LFLHFCRRSLFGTKWLFLPLENWLAGNISAFDSYDFQELFNKN
jgi:hypothetical protein